MTTIATSVDTMRDYGIIHDHYEFCTDIGHGLTLINCTWQSNCLHKQEQEKHNSTSKKPN